MEGRCSSCISERFATLLSAAGSAPSSPAVLRKIDAPEAKPLDLLDAAGGSVAKRALPLAALLALVLIVLGLRRRK